MRENDYDGIELEGLDGRQMFIASSNMMVQSLEELLVME